MGLLGGFSRDLERDLLGSSGIGRRGGKGQGFVSLSGEKELLRMLDRLMGPELLRVVKSASGKAMTPVRATARKRVGVKSGATKKAIIKKQVTYKNQGNVMTLVGVRVRTLKAVAEGKAVSNLAHLLEFGHRNVRGKASTAPQGGPGRRGPLVEDIGFVRPHPFLRPAYRENRQKIQDIYRRELEAGVHREARKGGFKA